MYTILCYGDSNTWGYNPATKERLSRDQRWTGVLKRELGGGFEVIEEGLNGRTTVWDDPIEGYTNGKEYLIPCLNSHRPVDLVTIMLGTNDLKKRFSLSAFDIAQGVAALVETVQASEVGPTGGAPRVLLVAPPPLGQLTELAEMFEGAEAKSRKLSEYYQQVADQLGCSFLDASTVIVSSDIDGVHLEVGEHLKLGKAMAGWVRKTLG